MATVEIRPFRRSDRDQLTALVNAHAQAVVPGVSVPVNTVLAQLEREPGEYVVEPWVAERTAIVAEVRGRVVAAAHLIRYRGGGDVGSGFRDAGEIRWLLCWPDEMEAGGALTTAALAVMRRWQVARVLADGSLPAPGVYSLPAQWPHVARLLDDAGFDRGSHVETVWFVEVADLPRPQRPDLGVERTLGSHGTRFTAVLDGRPVGFIEIDAAISGPGRLTGSDGWADVGNLHVDEAHRRSGVGTWLVGQAAQWLRLARVDRLLDYTWPTEPETIAFLTHLGFRQLTTTTRGRVLEPGSRG